MTRREILYEYFLYWLLCLFESLHYLIHHSKVRVRASKRVYLIDVQERTKLDLLFYAALLFETSAKLKHLTLRLMLQQLLPQPTTMLELDAHETPPQRLRDIYKKYSKKDQCDVLDVIDLGVGLKPEQEDAFSAENCALGDDRLRLVFATFVRSEDAAELTASSLYRGAASKTVYMGKTIEGAMQCRFSLRQTKSHITRSYDHTFSLAARSASKIIVAYVPS
jgi:hypothetical protein